jgi:hypothetical protein
MRERLNFRLDLADLSSGVVGPEPLEQKLLQRLLPFLPVYHLLRVVDVEPVAYGGRGEIALVGRDLSRQQARLFRLSFVVETSDLFPLLLQGFACFRIPFPRLLRRRIFFWILIICIHVGGFSSLRRSGPPWRFRVGVLIPGLTGSAGTFIRGASFPRFDLLDDVFL